jgi:hypothetical protein
MKVQSLIEKLDCLFSISSLAPFDESLNKDEI